jgi:transcriptional regulator with XRE-family HTH domain
MIGYFVKKNVILHSMATKKATVKKGPAKGTKYKDTNPFEFGRILAGQRRKKGLSQAELAELMGVSKRLISYYERELADPSMEIINNVCKALKISPRIFIEPSAVKETEEEDITWALKKRLEMVKTLPPKAKKSLQDYIDVLVKAQGKD